MRVFLLCFNIVAWADQVQLKNEEISEFVGNRQVKGVQKGQAWSQTFGPGSHTNYSEDGGFMPSSGTWKTDNDMYSSEWPPSNHWSCYKLMVEGENLTVVPSDSDPWPAVRQPLK